jgi:hypothetical protein
MNSTSRIAISAVVVGLSVLITTRLFAQDQEPSQPSTGSTEYCLMGKTPVQGAPFSADVSITWRPPASSGLSEQRTSNRYFRDREGRVRVEQGVVGGGEAPLRVFIAIDATHRIYIEDPAGQTASAHLRFIADMMIGGGCHDDFVFPISKRRLTSFIQHPLNEEPLGERKYRGVMATGTRFTTELPLYGDTHSERWVSSELRLVLYLIQKNPKWARSTMR